MAQDKISIDRIDELLRLVFEELKKTGGRARPKEILGSIEGLAKLSEYEQARTRTGAVRWQTHLRFYTIDCVKAGYLAKSGGHWILTQEGEEALKLPKGQLIRSAMKKYQDWKGNQPSTDMEPPDEATIESEKVERQTVYEQAVEDARTEIEEHINKIDPYDFQKLVAELLSAMGYHISNVAAPGPDGGVDIWAYTDPLGSSGPRIIVQVRHRDQKATAKDVRELEGLLRRQSDIGLLVSSGGFTNEATRESRLSNKQIETMDLDKLVSLWQEHYEKIRESGKALLPLAKVFFLAPEEE